MTFENIDLKDGDFFTLAKGLPQGPTNGIASGVQKISEAEGGLGNLFDGSDDFGWSVTNI